MGVLSKGKAFVRHSSFPTMQFGRIARFSDVCLKIFTKSKLAQIQPRILLLTSTLGNSIRSKTNSNFTMDLTSEQYHVTQKKGTERHLRGNITTTTKKGPTFVSAVIFPYSVRKPNTNRVLDGLLSIRL